MIEMLEDAKAMVRALNSPYFDQHPKLWGENFVELRIWFHRKHGRGLVLSTLHGIDFFQNVVDACEGRMKWKEEGIYGDNFRKLIKEGNV